MTVDYTGVGSYAERQNTRKENKLWVEVTQRREILEERYKWLEPGVGGLVGKRTTYRNVAGVDGRTFGNHV